VGDDYLKKAGEIFRRHLRSEDRVFRLGTHSDTFVVHLSGFLSPEELLNVKDRINKSFEDAQREFREKYPDIDISVSMASTSYDANLSPMAAATDAENRISEAKREKRKLGFRGVQVDIPEKINV
jgi:GGDEF domain-containing protein